MDAKKYAESQFKGQIQETVRLANELRNGGTDVSLSEIVKDKLNVSMDTLYESLGINPNVDSISNIFTTSSVDNDARWLIPELYRDALRLGLEKAPIWGNVTASEETTSQLSQKVPSINRSDATPKRVGEAETIPMGTVSFQQKSVDIYKIGRGMKLPYEVMNYVSLNMVSIFMEDFGKQLGLGLDALAIDTLINGEQADGSESAGVIGVTTGGTKVYKDFLRAWVRAGRMGRNFGTIIGGENAAMDTLDLPEFKTNNFGGTAAAGVPTTTALNFQSPLPSSAKYFVHGNVPANQEILVDPSAALIKLNAQPLLVESEKIVSNQTEAFYASLTTGFFKVFRDAALIMDKSVAFTSFPSYMDVDSLEAVDLTQKL